MAPPTSQEANAAPPRGEQAKGNRKSSKLRTLELIKSLEADDDERTAISKKISWILRHGAQKVNIKADDEGWIKVSDLLETEILEEVSKDTLMAVIVDSNAQKLRYKLKDDCQYIKAYSKTERKATTEAINVPPEKERKSQGTLRQDAPAFVPSGTFSSASGANQPGYMGYPWPMLGGFGFPPMVPQWPGGYPVPPFMMDGSTGGAGATARYRGRIKSFNPEKGFGFIDCADTYAQFNRDVFLHKAQFGDMTVGTEVTFLVETNKQGMPQAKDLQVFGAAGGAAAGSGKGGRGKGKGGRGKGGQGVAKGAGKADRGSNKGNGQEAQQQAAEAPSAAASDVPAPAAEVNVAEASAAGVPPAEASTKEAAASDAPAA